MIPPLRHFRRQPAFTLVKPGFTLVELMISIALVLLLVTGINEVFSLTSKTVGAGQASSAAQRDMRAAQKVMQDDFNNALTTNGPCFIIYSRRQWAFRNKQDQLSDHDGNAATKDVQNLGTENQLPAAVYNDRSHRIDMIKFFARGAYHRQTGDPLLNTIISSTTSNEAWITYGHGQLPDNTSTFSTNTMPGSGTITTNPNNFYSSQWILTRVAMLLKPSVQTEMAFRKVTINGPPDLTPLKMDTLAKVPPPPPTITPPAGTFFTENSRYDLAETSIDSWGQDLAARIRAGNAPSTPCSVWYRIPTGATLPANYTTDYGNSPSDLLYRMQCNPFIQRPISSNGVAVASPQFVSGCSQFIVEFAGDFVSQTNIPTDAHYGEVTNDQPDGVLDYYVPQTGPNAGTRQIRWYGLPRDTDGDGSIHGATWNNTATTNNQLLDVVPLRDVIRTGQSNPNIVATVQNRLAASTGASFECETMSDPTANTVGIPIRNDYGALNATDDESSAGVGMSRFDNYLCIWNYSGPQMIRITMTVDDPAGRLNNGATFEYIFTLKK